jgi:hypothetical protein
MQDPHPPRWLGGLVLLFRMIQQREQDRHQSAATGACQEAAQPVEMLGLTGACPAPRRRGECIGCAAMVYPFSLSLLWL